MKYFAPERTSFAIVVLAFLSLLFTYPTIVQLSTHLIGGTADGWQFPWNNYIFRERVLQGQDPYFTDYVFYPVGVSLILHGYTEFNNVIGLVLSPVFNDVAVTNLMVILATFLSGFGTYLLTRELTGSPIAGLFAGIAFAFCPFRMIRIIGHIHMALTQFLPFAIWAMLKMGRTQKIRYAILTGLFFALACYCNYYFVIYLLIAFLLMVTYGMIRYSDWRTISFFRNLILSGAVAVLLLLPVVYHTYLLLKSGTAQSYSAEEAFYVKNAADLWDYLRIAPLNRAVLNLLGESPVIWPYSRVTSGWTVLLLFLPGLIYIFIKRPRYFGMLVFTGLGFFLLSLGPFLKITDAFRLPLPYSLISKIPILSHARVPDRFGIMVNLVMAVIAGFMLSYISGKLSRARRKALYFATFSLLLFELSTIPFPMESFDPPKIFYQLAQNKGNAMLSLPFYPGNIRAKQYMRFQSVHEQRLLDGRVSRNPWLPIKFIKNLPITRTFHSMTIGTTPGQDVVKSDRSVAPLFRELFHVRTLALYPPFTPQENRNYMKTVFPDAELLSDEKGILVYRLPQREFHTYRSTREDDSILFFLVENWQLDRRADQFVCREKQAKLLLPDVKPEEVLILKLRMRVKKQRSSETNLSLKIGNYFIGKKSLKSEFQLWRMEIPGQVLKKEGRIAQIDIKKTFADSAVELESIELKVGAEHFPK